MEHIMNSTLYYSPGACSLAPHIVLEEIGNPFKLQLVSTSSGATRSLDHLKINPKGRVPVLITSGKLLTESPAILLYLALSNPDSHLLPNDPEAIARSVEWLNWLSGTVHAVAIRQIWRAEDFTSDETQTSKVVENGKRNLETAFAYIEARMADRKWALEYGYSIVDPYLLVIYRWGNRIGFDMQKTYPLWTTHTLQMLERNAVKRALLTENISVWA
jgi:glutathione S-transferase